MDHIRETLRIVVVGHVDHGKSTLIGRLLYDTKSLPDGAVDKVKRISKEKGKPFEYAYLLDAFEEEQKQGITIDTTQIQFFTEKRDYVIIDAPGHKEFLKNMISGAASAEAAMLIIDAHEGIQEQSKRHGYILSLLGIQKVYVLVNKMDLIDYSEEKFNQIKEEFNMFLNNLNVFPEKYIPISAFNGENITIPSEQMPWSTEVPVLEALDLFEKEKGLEERPLRFPIQDVYKFDDRRIIAGRIEAGRLNVGDEITISPGNKVTRVKSIEYWTEKDKKEEVSAGMSVGITLEDEFFNNRGELISQKEEQPLVGESIKASIFWLGKTELSLNKPYRLKLATQDADCSIEVINKVIDATTLKTIDDATSVKLNDVAEVIIKTKRPIWFDKFSSNQSTGRFVLMDGYDVSGGGIIADIEEQSVVRPIDRYVKVTRLVTRHERESKYNQKAKVILFAGEALQESARVAVQLEKYLFDLGKKVYFLDNAEFSNAKDPIAHVVRTAGIFLDNGVITLLADVNENLETYKSTFADSDLIIHNVKKQTQNQDFEFKADLIDLIGSL